MSAPIRVLILGDRAADINLILHELRRAGFEPDWQRVETEPEYLKALEVPPELILADWSLQSFNGLRALQLMQERNQDVPFIIVVSNSVEEDAAIEAVRQGASDYLMNDRMVWLGQVVQRALENKRLRQERRQAEETLRESERQYRDLFENTVLGIFRVTVEGKPLAVNPRFASMLGYASPNEFLSTITNAAEIFVDPRRRAEILRMKTENQALTTFESQYRRKDGSTFVGNLTLHEIAGSEGEVAYLEGFLEDITERERAEETLRKSEARFRTIFENSTAGAALVSLDGRYLMVNPAFCDIYGFSAEELMQRNFFQITHPEDIALSQKVMQKVVDSKGKSIQFTKRYIHKDGHTIWAELSSALVYNSHGQPEYFITHVSDVTERKRIEEALRKSETELRALVEQIPAIVYTESVEKPGKTLYISPQIETTSGYTPAEWMSSANFWDEIVHPDDLDNLNIVDELTNRTGDPFRAEYRILKRDGSALWVRDEAVLIRDEAGHALFWQGVMHDISDKKRAEEALQESEKRFSTIFQTGPISISIIRTLDEQIIEVNPAFLSMFGFTRDEVIGHTALELNMWVTSKEHDRIFKILLKDGKIKEAETKFRLKSGKIGDALISAELIELANEKHILAVMQDITERKRAEEALRKSEEAERLFQKQLRTLLEVSNELSRADSVDEVCRQAVELGRTRLGFDRLGIWFCSPDSTILTGSFGTDTTGNECDERETQLPVDSRQNDILSQKQPITLHWDDVDLFDGKGNIVGHGERAQAVMWDGEKAIGFISTDNFIRHKPITNRDCDLLGLYASTLGNLCSRKRTEEALSKSEAELRALFAAMPDFVLMLDRDGHYLQIASTKPALLYKPSDELLGKTIDAVLPEAEAKLFLGKIREALNLRKMVQLEYSLPIDGQIIWLSAAISPVTDNAVVWVARDITERKQSEESLKLKMEQLVALNQASQAVATSLDLQQILTEVVSLARTVAGSDYASILLLDEEGRTSGTVEDLPGVPMIEHQPRGRGFTNWILHSHQPVIVDGIGEKGAIRPLVGRGAPRTANPYLLANGIKSFVGLPLMVKGHILGVLYMYSLSLGAFHDQLPVLTTFANQAAVAIEKAHLYDAVQKELADRKQAEKDLRESEERYRMLFEISPDAIAVHQDGKVVFANPAMLKLVGASTSDKLVGKEILVFVHPDYRHMVIERIHQQTIEGKVTPIAEEKYVRLDGSVIDVDVTAAPIYYRDEVSSMVIIRDITERKQVEYKITQQANELRRRNEELARLYRVSGSLVSGTSLTLQEQAQKIVEVVQQEFGQANCSLLFVHKDSNELVRMAMAGPYADQVKNKELSLGGPDLSLQAIRTRETLNVRDIHSTPGYVSSWEAAQSELAIPLKAGGDVIGVIDVQSAELAAFSEDDERLMTVFAERAALALENSLLDAQTDARMRQLMALRTIDTAISSSFEINLTLGILLDQLIGYLGVHAADILVFNVTTMTFKLACERGFRMHMPQQTLLNSGMGYAWRAVRERQMVIISNIQAEPAGIQGFPSLSGEQFVNYIGIPLIAKGQVKGVLEIFHREPLVLAREQIDFLETLSGQAAIAMDNTELFDHLQSLIASLNIAYDSTLEGWASALELRDKETGGHTRRVTEMTVRLAQAIGVNENDMVHIYRGALLHDIGKMGVPDSIMFKTGPLTEDEWSVMRKHPQYAYDLLSQISYLHPALDIPYCHHEKWDGTGYPRGLKGEQIPLPARIFAIVDVWDALSSDRPYRKGWTKEAAINHIRDQAGKQFDPRIAEIFLNELLHAK